MTIARRDWKQPLVANTPRPAGQRQSEQGSQRWPAGHGEAVSAPDDLSSGVLLVSNLRAEAQARPTRQRVCGPVGYRRSGQRYQKG